MYLIEICCGVAELMKFVKKANEEGLDIVAMSENTNERYTVIYEKITA
jgi:hypothetical protein